MKKKPKCTLAIGPGEYTKITKKGFIEACKKRYSKAQSRAEHNCFTIGSQGLNIMNCPGCKVGELVVKGKTFRPPKGIKFIKIEEETGMSNDYAGSEVLNPIPSKQLSGMTVVKLKKYWKAPLIPLGKKGQCPCCMRDDMSHAAAGLCGSCYRSGQGRTGIRLIDAMMIKRNTLRKKKGLDDKEPVKRETVKEEHERHFNPKMEVRCLQLDIVSDVATQMPESIEEAKEWAIRISNNATKLAMAVAKI